MLNQIILIGRLTADPEIVQTKSGKSKLRFTLAVNRPYKDENGSTTADFLPIVAWNSTAENTAKYCTKGSLVAVEGSLQSRNYETESGAKRTTYEVIANRITFLDRRKNSAGADEAVNDDDDDLPF